MGHFKMVCSISKYKYKYKKLYFCFILFKISQFYKHKGWTDKVN